jgi:hypothetical protein
MTNLARTVSELTFSYADREARWFNRYNKDNRDLEWAYKEGFYQARIKELLELPPEGYLEKIHAALIRAMKKLPGEAERNRSPEELEHLIDDFQRSNSPPRDS